MGLKADCGGYELYAVYQNITPAPPATPPYMEASSLLSDEPKSSDLTNIEARIAKTAKLMDKNLAINTINSVIAIYVI